MPILVRDLIDGGYVSEEDIKAANFKHICPHCNRSFNSKHGLSVHIGRWCGEATREAFAQSFEVSKICDARGPPGNRFYRVEWCGHNDSSKVIAGTQPCDSWPDTWEPERYLSTASASIDEFWNQSNYDIRTNISVPGEFRCTECGKFCKSETGLKIHCKACKSVPGSRRAWSKVCDVTCHDIRQSMT